MSPPAPDLAELLAELESEEPAARMARLEAAGAPDEVLGALGDEAERLAVVQLSRGLAATDLVVTLADTVGSKLTQARVRRGRVKALAYAGRFAEALAHCRAATKLAEDAGDAIEAARSRLVSMQALAELGRFDESIAEGTKARHAFVGAGEPHLAARADANLGTAYQRRGMPEKALAHFDAARRALADEPITAAQLDSNRAEALLALNDFRGAERAFGEALKLLEAEKAGWSVAIVEGNLADLATRLGRLHEALYYFERSRRHLESDASPGHLARLLAEQADAMALLGLPEDALQGYRRALGQLDGCGLVLEAARARAGMGRVLLQLGELSEAQTLLAAAARSFDEIGHTVAAARVDVVRGELAAAQGRHLEARTLMVRALRTLESRPLDEAVCRYHLARLHLQEADPTAAEAQLAAALDAARRLDVAPLVADLLHTRGLCRQSRGRLDEAVGDLTDAVAQIERVRGSLQATRFRAAYLTNRLRVYEDLVTTLLTHGGVDAVGGAFFAAEQAKSRSLLDLVGSAAAHPERTPDARDDPATAALADEVTRLRGELNALYSRLGEPSEKDEAMRLDPAVWRREVRRRERDLEAVQCRLATVRGGAGLYAPTADLAAAQRLLGGDTVLIEYFLAGDELLCFVVRDGGAEVHRGLGDPVELAGAVRRFQFQIARGLRPGALESHRGDRLVDDALTSLEDLSRIVLKPLGEQVAAARRLIIIPHGPLHLVPFAALLTGGRHLIETHELTVAPSASLLVHLNGTNSSPRPPQADRSRPVLVVGVADEHAPKIATEAHRVAEALGCERPLIGAKATAARVTEAAREARIVHLACHGRFSAAAPLGSGLKLADGWLTVGDIYLMRLCADLVVLSGCETGKNVIRAGDELVGLLSGFFAAGARSLLASLWRVNDESTSEFMCIFYGLLNNAQREGMSIAVAVGEAQRRLLDRHRHPALWAPFVLVGGP